MSRNKRLCLFLLVCNIAFIWGNSCLPASISGTISQWLHDLLQNLFPGGEPSQGHGLLRKCAHMAEFALLGALFTWYFTLRGKWIPAALPCSSLVAAVDETIQRFVPGRGPSLWDVLIDTCGAILGIGLFFAVTYIIKKQKFWRNKT